MSLAVFTVSGLPDNAVSEHAHLKNEGDCVAFNGNARKFIFTKCTLSLLTYCQKKNGSPVALPSFGNPYLTWAQVAQACVTANFEQLAYNGTLNLPTTVVSQLWTGMVRIHVIKANLRKASGVTGYGYVKVYNNTAYVRFDPSPSEQRKFLCATDMPQTTTSRHSPRPETVPTPEPEPPKPEPETPEPEEEPEPESAAEIHRKMLPLYIIVPIVVLVILICILIVVWRRRRLNRQERRMLEKYRNRAIEFDTHSLPRSDIDFRTHKPTDDDAISSHTTNSKQPILDNKNKMDETKKVTELDATIPLDDETDTMKARRPPMKRVESDGGYGIRMSREDNIGLPVDYGYASVNRQGGLGGGFYDVTGRDNGTSGMADSTYARANFEGGY
ncbi:uncharacterized protein LOC128235946 [Mya arenaria]|uniref:uncharacterized protein LOC128235946 n=1 Tax=Mya arenaria TaxID=6604 RepID=UPI0022E81D56|nr:uncharacterized protein LOC128235946 [Mya arenaria]